MGALDTMLELATALRKGSFHLPRAKENSELILYSLEVEPWLCRMASLNFSKMGVSEQMTLGSAV